MMPFLLAWQILAAKIHPIVADLDFNNHAVNRSIHHRNPKDKRNGCLRTVFTIGMPLLPEMVRIT